MIITERRTDCAAEVQPAERTARFLSLPALSCVDYQRCTDVSDCAAWMMRQLRQDNIPARFLY